MSILKNTFGKDKRWVTWQYVTAKGKKTKIPYSINGQKASSTDASTWSTYDEVKQHAENVGIIFTPEQDLLGIDIDHCLKDNKIEHEQKEKIAQLILEADTYTEISPSGEGLHLFLKIDGKLPLTSNKKAPFEAYTNGRYFTVTENPYGESRDVRTVTPDEALEILAIIDYPWKRETNISTIPNSTHGTDSEGITRQLTHTSLTDSEVLEKMFASKNGAKIKKLYEGDLSQNKDDASQADMSLCSHLSFWTGKNHDQIERIWKSSPLGNRKKTQSRNDYRLRTIGHAIDQCSEVYENMTIKLAKIAPKVQLLYVLNTSKEKVYVQNTENMCRILRGHVDFEDRFRFDVFKSVYEIKPKKTGKWRPLEDNDAVNIQTEIQILYPCFLKVGKDIIYDAIIKVSKENTVDSASDFIQSIVWDKTSRLDSWLTNTYGVPNDIYHQAVGSNWIKGLVKRITEPGCKFDYVLVLEGPQGSKKSTSLAVLGRDWHVETTMSTESKDFFMQFSGKAIIEFSEGETLSRTEVKRMKAIITMQSDKYRPPYERVSQDFPRRCVFAMTTNQTEYLKDETGNRRWLPISVILPEANVEWLEENRNQIFAEAHYRVTVLKEKIYEFPKEETLNAQEARRINDPNTDLIREWYYTKLTPAGRSQGITTHQVFRDAIHSGYNTKPLDRYNEMSIADVLKRALKLTKRRASFSGQQMIRWFDDSNGIQEPVSEFYEFEEHLAK